MDTQDGGPRPHAAPSTGIAPNMPDPASLDPASLENVDAQLATLADLTVAQHVEVFSAIHRQLTDALAVTGSQNTQQQRPGSPPHQVRPGQPHQQRGR